MGMAHYKMARRMPDGSVEITLLDGTTVPYETFAASHTTTTPAPGDYYDPNVGLVYERDYLQEGQ